ncbi:hypothetical protein [Caulobacter sp. FWC2]|uniref:hypothetical protein n=1 Tax=Caulobacter sp. FWC2 TaxID=69664 RepID=UPI000C160D2C|nr:hypothetical protein [Caulobacter sp. FWC2]PIB92389.1 hypothetical protein CSW62_12935 [Caulobacter sp. FWC2]
MASMNLPPPPAAVAGPVIETRSSPRLKILWAHANPDPKGLLVAGQVRRGSATVVVAGGHLDVDAYAATGVLIAHRTTRWNGLLNGGRGSHPAGYAVRLDVAASDVARIVVSHHLADHRAMEAGR